MTKLFIIAGLAIGASLAAPVAQAKGRFASGDEPTTGEISSFHCEAKFGQLAKSLAALPVAKTLPNETVAGVGN